MIGLCYRQLGQRPVPPSGGRREHETEGERTMAQYATIDITNTTDPVLLVEGEPGLRVHVDAIHLQNHGEGGRFSLLTMREKTLVQLLPDRWVDGKGGALDLNGPAPIIGAEPGEAILLRADSKFIRQAGALTYRVTTD
ncbi:MAG: hypothetical protein KC486_36280 [Myxococcales bacterium]|nr:hypothetical protein [Myxococcales bacterium]